MSTTEIFQGYGPIPNTEIDTPDENGWISLGCCAEGPDSAGDYCLSRVFETRYLNHLADGRVLVIDVAYYVETVQEYGEIDYDEDGEPIYATDRMGPVERTRCASYASERDYEEGYEEFDSYEYENVGYLFRNSIEEYEAEAYRMATPDLRWALCWDGSRF